MLRLPDSYTRLHAASKAGALGAALILAGVAAASEGGFALAALFTGLLGALMAGATVVIVFWDTHRVAAALAVTAMFFGAAILCALLFRQRLRQKPRLLDATRSELKKDLAAIRSHQ